ncbi:MAG: hypothetical protein ACLTD6_06005 [Clostridium paraputrificum]
MFKIIRLLGSSKCIGCGECVLACLIMHGVGVLKNILELLLWENRKNKQNCRRFYKVGR